MEKAKGIILIVDDEESIRDLLSTKLKADGYDCEVAADGNEALWKAFMKDFDIVLLDIKMPGLSRMEQVREYVSGEVLMFSDSCLSLDCLGFLD